MYYVVTEYWSNGESWGDEHHTEEPIGVYKTVKDIPNEISKDLIEIKEVEKTYFNHTYETHMIDCGGSDIYDQSWKKYKVYLVGDEID